MQESPVAIAEAVAVIFPRGWRDGRLPEARVAGCIGRDASRHVMSGSEVAVMEALLRDGAEGWRWG